MTLTSIVLPAGLTSVGEIAPQTRSHADDESEPADAGDYALSKVSALSGCV